MAQEDRKCSSGSGSGAGGSGGGILGCGSVGSGSRSSKKQKQKKPPQRGLGVAQLERLRMEEQQKKDASSLYPPPITFNSSSLSSSLPNFQAESLCSVFRHTPSVPDMDLVAASPVWSQSSRNYCKHDGEMSNPLADRKVDQCSKFSPLESYPVLRGHELMQRLGSDRPPLLVNATPAISTSLQNYQLEPPSNQSHHHGSFSPYRSLGEKMLGGGTKRSRPFSLANPPAAFSPFKLPKMGNPADRPDEPSVTGMSNLRQGPCSVLESSSSESVKENKVSGGEFLTLAPPLDTPPQQNWQPCQNLTSSAPRSHCLYPGFDSPPYQGYPEGLSYGHAPGWTDQRPRQLFQPQHYSFLPPMLPLMNVEERRIKGRKDDPSGSIDLDLKL
ncbi:hypothetical protein MLD38_000480 [Melastoma candidum]|uniref:Uncharacterized protein n=1 Tax=Melastoma candidum TaxID=119954 RepID=A0ACB9SAA3_9MYRT|nr:hypothetical protein MLD38_000480 [Melastoma candidum]